MVSLGQFHKGFEIENEIEGRGQISRDFNSAKMHFWSNLEILTSIGGELWHGQAHNVVNVGFNLTLKVNAYHPTKQQES